MDEKEILGKSRNYSFNMDEKDLYIKVIATEFGFIGFGVIAIIIGIINVTVKDRNLISNELLSVVCTYGLFRLAIVYKETASLKYLIYALLNLVIALVSLYFFVIE